MAEKRPRKRRKTALPRAQEAPRYEFGALVRNNEELREYATESAAGLVRLDLSSRAATLALTRAILRDHFNLTLALPEAQLVPTVPNRVQYLTWAAALLSGDAPQRRCVVVDVGTGPSCIYAMLGARLFPNWEFVATDTDQVAIEAARRNVEDNHLSKVKVFSTARADKLLPSQVVSLKPTLIVCNPPFHAELPETASPAGSRSQLVTTGGELAFLCCLANESIHAPSVEWFTSLVGRKVDLPKIVAFLCSSRIRAPYVKTVELSQGGRTARWAVAWSFGQERSVIRLVDEQSSKWRFVFSVQPGRRYANQLCVNDVEGVFEAVLVELQWSKRKHADVQFHGPQDCVFTDTALQLRVTKTEVSNCFLMYIKVADRGSAGVGDFKTLCCALQDMASHILNDALG